MMTSIDEFVTEPRPFLIILLEDDLSQTFTADGFEEMKMRIRGICMPHVHNVLNIVQLSVIYCFHVTAHHLIKSIFDYTN